ncbi:oligosaccharide flippase family protein [Candidatus Nomurabacteria bacterium]|nr:oligosaccharide flippase family protein [Candidatus Nomurabacteria bacterium]
MLAKLRNKIYQILRWSEKYTKTDMVYLSKGGFWLNLNTLGSSLLALILSILFANFLSKENYGNYQFLISLSTIIGTLTLTGINIAVTQSVAKGSDQVFKQAIREQIKFLFIPFLFSLLLFVYYFYFLNNTLSISLGILIIGLLIPLNNTLNTWVAFLQGKKDFKNIFLNNQFINFIYYLGMILGVVFIKNITLLISINFLLLVFSNLIIYIRLTKKYQFNQNRDDEAIKYGKKLSLSNILPLVAFSVPSLAIFYFQGAAALAIYSFAANIPERIINLFKPAITMALPKLSEKESTGNQTKNIFQKTIQLLIFSLAIGLLYIFAAPFIFKVFFPQYLESIVYSQIYILSAVIYLAGNLPITSLFATRSNKIFIFNIANPAFTILITIGLIYFYGIWGAILGKMISNIFSLTLSYNLKKRDL